MDIRAYFGKLRDVEHSIATPWVVVCSLSTPDGGRAGVFNEVSRENAAQLLVEGRARMATEDEAAHFRDQLAVQRETAEQELAAGRIQFTLVPDEGGRSLRPTRPAKS